MSLVRRSRVARIAPLLLVAALACSRTHDAPPAAAHTTTTPPAGDGGAIAGLTPMAPDTALAQLREYRLSMDALQRWARAQRALNDLTRRDSTVLSSLAEGGRPTSMDQMIARFDHVPRIHDALHGAGMSAHDYVLTMVALQQGMQGYVAKQTKQLRGPVTGALGDNIAFVEQNIGTIRSMLTTLQPDGAPGR